MSHLLDTNSVIAHPRSWHAAGNIDLARAYHRPHDLMIASISLAHGLTLVTHNLAEFGRVPGLTLEDWNEAGKWPPLILF